MSFGLRLSVNYLQERSPLDFQSENAFSTRFRDPCNLRKSKVIASSQKVNFLAAEKKKIDKPKLSCGAIVDVSNSAITFDPEFPEEDDSTSHTEHIESFIERQIFNCRFMTLMAIWGSLVGSFLCFGKGCILVLNAFKGYFTACMVGHFTGDVIFLLVEALDIYLMGTVMLIFGMGLYELFITNFDNAWDSMDNKRSSLIRDSSLFGLFKLRKRPQWLEIRSLDELKTKLGHVIVMILLVGMFEKSKKVPIKSINDLVMFSFAILLASSSLYLLSRLHSH